MDLLVIAAASKVKNEFKFKIIVFLHKIRKCPRE